MVKSSLTLATPHCAATSSRRPSITRALALSPISSALLSYASNAAVIARITPIRIDPMASNSSIPVAWPRASATKATKRPSMAAVSSNRTVKIVGSLLSRTAAK